MYESRLKWIWLGSFFQQNIYFAGWKIGKSWSIEESIPTKTLPET
jgi:hypothetical protein